MNINIINLNKKIVDDEVIEKVSTSLERGEVIVAPTETRYGMLVRADDKKALNNLYKVKQRSKDMPVAVFLPDYSIVNKYALTNKVSDVLAKEFLPGPLTLVLKRKDSELEIYGDTVGIRVSDDPFMSALVKAVSFPVTATSANISGSGDNETIEQIIESFENQVAMYIDSGRLTGNVSTVVDCSNDICNILRESAISESRIKSVVKNVQ